MSKRWDNALKRLFTANPQHFLNWLLPGAIFIEELPNELKNRLIEPDGLYMIIWHGKEMILHIEFQVKSDPDMGKRLWEYNATATILYGRPTYSFVIYLQQVGNIVESPYKIPSSGSEVVHIFYYQNVKLWEIPTEVFKKPGLEGLLPLLPLTANGKRLEIVDEAIMQLQFANRKELLPLAYILASLVFKKKDDREWIKERFVMLEEILEDTWAYQEIMNKGQEKEREKERVKFRETIIMLVNTNFSSLVPLVNQQVQTIKDIDVLQQIILDLYTLHSNQDVEQYLLSLGDDEDANGG